MLVSRGSSELVEKGISINDGNDAFFEYGKKVLVEHVEIIKVIIILRALNKWCTKGLLELSQIIP
jgi:hypothetical protein